MGTGIDILKISRVKKLVENEKFLSKIFSQKEIEYFKTRNFNISTVAGNFCAKEAFSKAIGTGILGFSHKDIEILHKESGAPYIKLYNSAQEIFGNGNIHLSLSHSREYATAVVVIEEGI